MLLPDGREELTARSPDGREKDRKTLLRFVAQACWKRRQAPTPRGPQRGAAGLSTKSSKRLRHDCRRLLPSGGGALPCCMVWAAEPTSYCGDISYGLRHKRTSHYARKRRSEMRECSLHSDLNQPRSLGSREAWPVKYNTQSGEHGVTVTSYETSGVVIRGGQAEPSRHMHACRSES